MLTIVPGSELQLQLKVLKELQLKVEAKVSYLFLSYKGEGYETR